MDFLLQQENILSNWETIRWKIPLGSKPKITSIGASVHRSKHPERFLLPEHWCLHLYSYRGILRLGGDVFPIRPGYVGITPPNIPIEYTYEGTSPHLYVHFRCNDSRFEESRIEEGISIPAMQDLDTDFGGLP